MPEETLKRAMEGLGFSRAGIKTEVYEKRPRHQDALPGPNTNS